LSLGRSAAVLLSLWSTILRLARRRTVLLLRGRTAVLRRRTSVAALRTTVLGRRCPTVLLRRRRLLLWIRRVGRRRPLLGVGRRLSAGKTAGRTVARGAALVRVRGVRRCLTALLRIRRVRRLLLRVAAALRRPLRHERVAGLPRRRLTLAGRRVALLLWRVALRRPVAVARLRRRVAVTITRPRRPARRKHRAARTFVEIKFRAPHAIDAMLSP